MQPFEQNDVEVLDEIVETDVCRLVVFNDNINTFDYVIDTLIEICQHTQEQAEQCTIIIHYKGKCAVKSGSWEDLVPKRNEICRRGISAEIFK